jgi:Icc-related predicted phosphoesterase
VARQILTGARQNVHYLHDEHVILGGIKFYGSPYQPEFFNWAFNLRRGPEIAAKWEIIPDDTEVLITHGPPSMIGDQVNRDGTLSVENVGCRDLSRRIAKLPKLGAHICGHIHEGHGLRVIDGVNYINASVLDDRYAIAYKTIELDL